MAKRTRRRRVLRILVRIALGLVLLVALAMTTVVIAVNTDWGRNKIRGAIVDAMASSFPCGVTIGAVEGNPLGDAVVRDLALTDCDGRPAVTVDRAELNVDLSALLGRTIALEYLHVHGVAIDVRRPSGGPINLVAMFKPAPGPLGWDIALPDVNIGQLAVSVDLGGTVAHLDGLDLSVAATVPAAGPIDASVALGGRWRERDLALSAVATVRVAGGVITSPSLELAVAERATPAVPLAHVAGTDVRYTSPTDVTGTIDLAVGAGALPRILGSPPPNPAMTATLAIAPAGNGLLGVSIDAKTGTIEAAGWLAVTPALPIRIAGVVRGTGVDLDAFVPVGPATHLDGTVVFGGELVAEMIPFVGVAFATGGGSVGGFPIDGFTAHAAVEDGLAHLLAHVTAPGDADARIAGELVIRPDGVVAFERTRVVAHVGALDVLLPGAGLHGAAAADLVVAVELSAAPLITATGRVTGQNLRRGALHAGRLTADLRGVRVDVAAPDRPLGSATLVASGGTIAGTRLPTIHVDATSRAAGGYRIDAHSSGDQLVAGGAPWSIELDGVVHPGAGFRSATIDLGDYTMRSDGVPWTGRGGRIVASARQIGVTGVTTTIDRGTVAVDGTLGLGGGPIDATVRLDQVDLARIDRALGLTARGFGPLRGTANLAGNVHRRRGRLSGSVAGTVSGFAVRADGEPLEVTIDATLAPDRIAGKVTAHGTRLGAIEVALDVTPPRDPTDLRAWARLERASIRAAAVRTTHVDLTTLAAAVGAHIPAEGTVTASLDLSPTTSAGEVHAYDLIVPEVPGAIDLDGTFDLAAPGVVTTTATATLRDVAHGTIEATFAIPSRPFDIAAWRRLDLTALRGATVTIDEITVDQALATRFGLGTLRGRVAASIDIAEAVREVHTRAVARGVTGGPVVRPVDLVIDGTLDDRGARATLVGSIDGVAVLFWKASAPIDPFQLANGGWPAIAAVPITGGGTLVPTRLAPLMKTFGEEVRIGGTIQGQGTIGGRIGAPAATVFLVIENLGGKRSKVDRLAIDASYAGGVLTARLDAKEAAGSLIATATYDRAHPEAATAALTAHAFQLGPLLRLVPDAFGVRGVLDGDLRVRGLDPGTAVAEGTLTVTDAQVPIADQIGAITGGKVVLGFRPGHAHLEVTGTIETGDVELTADAVLDGVLPRTASVDVVVRDLAIISTLAPRVAGALHADVALAGDHWNVIARLSDGRVVIPDDEGKPLHAAGPPADMVFIENGVIKTPARVALRTLIGRIPTNPFLVVGLRIDPVAIVSKQLRGEVGGHLQLAIGTDGVSLDGTIEARRGEVMVFDRRYLLSRASVTFDGGLDPEVDLQMSHDFSELTLQVYIKGRLSNPELEFAPAAGYTQGQLLGFLLGGTPGAAAQDTTQALTGAATAVASQAVSGFVTRKLPVKLDVLRFEPKTSTSSAAFVFGEWVTSKLLVLIRSRVASREDENRAETELEIWLGRRVLLDAVGGDKGVLGLDLLWTRRW